MSSLVVAAAAVARPEAPVPAAEPLTDRPVSRLTSPLADQEVPMQMCRHPEVPVAQIQVQAGTVARRLGIGT